MAVFLDWDWDWDWLKIPKVILVPLTTYYIIVKSTFIIKFFYSNKNKVCQSFFLLNFH